MNQRVSGLIFSFMCFVMAIGGYLYFQQQKVINTLLEQQQTTQPLQPIIQKEIIEKIVTAEPWSDLQSKVKNCVVQVFNQGAAIDLLQPYRSPTQYQATGSGFFINQEGEIITNAHVVDQAKAVWIQIPSLGKRQIDVDVVGVSPERDLAILKVRPEGIEIIKAELNKIPCLDFGDSDLVHRADEIMALGYPLGQQGLKSTTGVVSGREQHLIQIDAALNPGNSGGPSVNRNGQVIGINTMIALEAQNVGYIIPINELKIVLDDLRHVPLLRKPFLGIIYNPGSDDLTKHSGNPAPGGVYVVDVYKGSPLHKVGVQKGDMIYSINKHPIDIYGELPWTEDKISLIDYVSQLKLGQKVNLVLYRRGVRHEMNLTFDQAELLPVRRIYPGYEPIDYEIMAGIVVQPLTVNHIPLLVNAAHGLAKYLEMKYQMEPALVITHIFPDSQAHRARALTPGAILNEVNGHKVKTMNELRQALFSGIATGSLTVETSEGAFMVCPFDKVLQESIRLSKDYFFALSPTMKTVIAHHEKKYGPLVQIPEQQSTLLVDNGMQMPTIAAG